MRYHCFPDQWGNNKGNDMARLYKALTAVFCRSVTAPGKYRDGEGLFLLVKPSGAKSWVQRITIHGRKRDLGVGGYPLVGLADARRTALENRKLARAGGDPLALRRKPDVPMFRHGLEAVLEVMRPNWRNPKSEKQWRASLETHAGRLMDRRVDQINSADVMAVLLPIWNEKRETARRVKQRISRVMLWACAEGYRTDDPAGAAISAALPKNGVKRQHFVALPYAEVGEAIAKVRASRAAETTKLCIEFIALTAKRSGEVRGAKWSEIDLAARTWTIPATRMKAGRAHREPLSNRAVAVLGEAAQFADGSELVFPSVTGRALSDSSLSKLVRELGIKGTVHGLRSSWRDWASEQTSAPRAVMEACLAHVEGNEAVAAYARSDVLEKRRALMSRWSQYLGGESGKVVKLSA